MVFSTNVAVSVVAYSYSGDVGFVDSWTVMATSLQDSGLSLEEVTENLVDTVWHAMGGRPPMPNNTLLILDMKYAGMALSKDDTVKR